MEEMEEKDPGYETSSGGKSSSGSSISPSPALATPSEDPVDPSNQTEDPTSSELEPIEWLELSDIKSAIAKKSKKLIKKVSGEQRVMILGRAASGKSTVGNTILGKKLFPVQRHEPSSDMDIADSFSKKARNRIGTRITVVETQGLIDSGLVDDQRSSGLVEDWLLACFPGPHVFVLVVDLFSYHQRQCQDADGVHRQADKDVSVGEAPISHKQHDKIAKKTSDLDIEQGWTENMAGKPTTGEQDPLSELLSIQKHFGEEALKFTILVFTHGDKLNPVTHEHVLKEDRQLMSLIGTLGGNQHVVCCSDSSRRANTKKLKQVMHRLFLRNGGKYYRPKSHKIGRKRINLANLLPFYIPVPPGLTSLDLSPQGITKLKRLIRLMAMGVFTGTMVGAVLGPTLKTMTFAVEQVGPSMICTLSLLSAPVIFGSSASSEIFPLDALTGVLIYAFLIIMTIYGALMGCVVGGRAAVAAHTLKDAGRIAAKAALENEKNNFAEAFRSFVERVGGGSEAEAVQAEEPGCREPSESGTVHTDTKVTDVAEGQEEETAEREQSSNSVRLQPSFSAPVDGTISPETCASDKGRNEAESVDVNAVTLESKRGKQAAPQHVALTAAESGLQQQSNSKTTLKTDAPEQHESGQETAITVEQNLGGNATNKMIVKTKKKSGKMQSSITLV